MPCELLPEGEIAAYVGPVEGEADHCLVRLVDGSTVKELKRHLQPVPSKPPGAEQWAVAVGLAGGYARLNGRWGFCTSTDKSRPGFWVSFRADAASPRPETIYVPEANLLALPGARGQGPWGDRATPEQAADANGSTLRLATPPLLGGGPPGHLAAAHHPGPNEAAASSSSSGGAPGSGRSPRSEDLGLVPMALGGAQAAPRAAVSRAWSRYELPDSRAGWWHCGDGSEEYFREDSPGVWGRFTEPVTGRPYWHNADTQEWFYEP